MLRSLEFNSGSGTGGEKPVLLNWNARSSIHLGATIGTVMLLTLAKRGGNQGNPEVYVHLRRVKCAVQGAVWWEENFKNSLVQSLRETEPR